LTITATCDNNQNTGDVRSPVLGPPDSMQKQAEGAKKMTVK
jgi:hypothetical protein